MEAEETTWRRGDVETEGEVEPSPAPDSSSPFHSVSSPLHLSVSTSPRLHVSTSSCSAILLAAGRSRRMGAFKPLLPFGGRSVVEACVANLHDAGVGEVLVVVGRRGASVRAALAGLPYVVRFAVNKENGSEMGVSLARGVEALPEDAGAVLIALVDQPAVPPEAVRSLIEAWRRTGARLVVPEWRGRGGHPVLVDPGFRAELLSLSPEKGLRALFDAHRAEVLRVSVDSPFVVRDMDTQADYIALHTDVFGSPPSGTMNAER